jgi:asparagine synthase (glutamine-hydrolysing)
MCGIGGIINFGFDNNLNYQELDIISSSIASRGPDGKGIWVSKNKNIGLVNRRLATQDARKKANQPIFSYNKNVVVVLNGEIYNHTILRNYLIKKGLIFKTHNDAEVIANGYEYWGNKILNKIEGQFSFCAYNNFTKKGIIARDNKGICPLYYYKSDNNLYFSSILSPLYKFAKKDNSFNINFKSITDFILGDMNYEENTFINSINNLKPGHIIEFNNLKIFQQKLFYKIPKNFFSLNQRKNILDFKDEIHSLLKDSINKTLKGDKKVGIYLSGGIDSISLLSLIKKYHPDYELKTFTAGFESSIKHKSIGEIEIAKKVSNYYGVKNYHIDINHKQVIDDLGKFDYPQASILNTVIHHLSKLTSRNNINVALSGEGADEMFLGYDHYLAIIKMYNVKYKKLLNRYNLRNTSIENNKKSLTNYFLGGGVDIDLSKNISNIFNNYECLDFSIKNSVKSTIKDLNKFSPKPQLDQLLTFIDYKYKVPENLLRRAEGPSMNNAVELRFPYLSNELINLLYSCPLDYKLGDGSTKSFLRSILANDLPQEFLYRPKSPFGLPAARSEHYKGSSLKFDSPAFKNIFNLNYIRLREILHDGKHVKQNIFNTDFIDKKFLIQEKQNTCFFDGFLWKVFSFCEWYEANFN